MADLIKLDNLPNLKEATPSPISLSAEYWTPEAKGEVKRVFIGGTRMDTYPKETDGGEVEEVLLECVIMIEQQEDGSFKVIKNGGKRLVAIIKAAIESGDIRTIEQGTPNGVQITYLGKKKNASNQFKSDDFDIRLLSM